MQKLFFSILLLACCAGCEGEAPAPKCSTCADFKTQAEAKAYSNANSKCAGNLDTDSDGIPCEHLPPQ